MPNFSEIPKNETIWVRGYDEEQHIRHVITSTKARDKYFLYLNEGGKLILLIYALHKVKTDSQILQPL